MIVEFEAALNYINLGEYEKAEKLLKTAIEKTAADNESLSMEYTCVLGELLLNTDKYAEARECFDKVIEYADENHTLQKQRVISKTYIDVLNGKVKPAPAPARPKDVPLVPKPVQNKAFISKKLNKH